MFIDLIKNPVIIGLIFAVGTFIYLKWAHEKRMKKKKTGKQYNINMLVPVVVGLITWFLAYGYFESTGPEPIESIISKAEEIPFSANKTLSSSESIGGSAQSYRLISGGANFPKAIDSDFPDVFIRTY